METDDPCDRRWLRGYAMLERFGLSFDLQCPWWHLPEAAALARAHPGTTLILDHTGLPSDRSEEGLALWRRYVADPPGVEGEALELSPDISWRRRLWWIALAFAPSSLMLGVAALLSLRLPRHSGGAGAKSL